MSVMSDICAICLGKTIFIYDLDETFEDMKPIEKLRICLPNQKWESFFKICCKCVENLNSAYKFIQLCIKTESLRLQQMTIPPQVENDSSSDRRISEDFTCYECKKTFKTKRTLSIHITRLHFHCKKEAQIKDELYNNANDLESVEETEETHSIKKEDAVHTPNNSNDSRHDDTSHAEKGDFDSRFSLYNGAVRLPCVQPKKKQSPKLKSPKKCEHCGLEFNRTDRYLQHVRSKHTFEKPFKCETCSSRYYSQHNLNIHLRKHRNERPFICATCGKCFISSNDLWQHNKTHDTTRKYACDECVKSFKTHSNLRTHKLQMHQDRSLWKFICTVCGKKFPLNNNLIKHMRRHEGIKDFECHLCNKKFVEKIDLQTHLLSHSNERHFKCETCFREYKKKETLRRHMKIEHNIGNFVVKKPEKRLNCPLCPKIFAFNNKLQRHLLTHTGERPVKCDHCDKRFRDTYDRNNHTRNVHNIDPNDSVFIFKN